MMVVPVILQSFSESFNRLFGRPTTSPELAMAGQKVASRIVDASKAASPIHPYYPTEAQIVGYVANSMSVPALLASFAGGCTVIFGITFLLVKRVRPTISRGDLATIMWFVLCGFIHLFFEGKLP
jgi:hypothetical protein